jgi:hypothetical protein
MKYFSTALAKDSGEVTAQEPVSQALTYNMFMFISKQVYPGKPSGPWRFLLRLLFHI